MAIVGGLDIHRKQLTFDYVDTYSEGPPIFRTANPLAA